MISSMNQSELYKTLVGHYKPDYSTYFPNSNNSKPAEKAEESKTKSIPENAVKVEDLPVCKEVTKDRFEHSVKISYTKGLSLYEGELKEMPYEASDGIDFMCNDIQAELGSGYTNGIATKERIAEYYGAMAKRLDTAYAEGKFTKDEYDELNEMIVNQIEKQTTVTENITAFYALSKKRYSHSTAAAKEVNRVEQSMTLEERLAEREQEIRDYAERYCKIDRVALMKLFNNIRFGKSK